VATDNPSSQHFRFVVTETIWWLFQTEQVGDARSQIN